MAIRIKGLLRIYLEMEEKHSQEIASKIRAGILIGAKLWLKERFSERLVKIYCKGVKKRT
jgi:hypothetical protein